MSRWTPPNRFRDEDGAIVPADVNDNFTTFLTAINNVAKGGVGIDVENLRRSSLVPSTMADRQMRACPHVALANNSVDVGGTSHWGQTGTHTYEMFRPPKQFSLFGYAFRWRSPGGGIVGTVEVLDDGVVVLGPFDVIDNTEVQSVAEAVTIAAQSVVAVRVTLGASITYLGRGTLYGRMEPWIP